MEGVPFSDTLARFTADPHGLIGQVPGIWLVDKPSGPTSNLVVVRARKKVGTKKIGHAGTLDPLASGLLVLLAGNATRLFDTIQESPKTYEAAFRLGERTDSQDITGQPLAGWTPTRALPIPKQEVEARLAAMVGPIMQVPPMHSALKRDGQPLYRLARQGVEVDRPPRPVTIYFMALLTFDGVSGTVRMEVSKGTYVRTVIDDLGVALGCGGVMTGLRRTQIGVFSVEEAMGFDELTMDNE